MKGVLSVETAVSLISDLIILIFDLSLYMRLTLLKKDCPRTRGIMYGGVCVITAAYVICAYVLHVPYSAASFLCMTVPSFLLFLFLSKYKTARFLVTFCFVDTVTFIIAAFGKIALILGGSVGGILSCLVLLILTSVTFRLVKPYCSKYRELQDRVSSGWAPMAVSTVFIYVLLIVSAAYPQPMITRLEYIPVYLLLCVTILSFYAVFIVLIMQKAALTKANRLLQQQQHWHDLAYLDELTHLANPASYAARTQELESSQSHDSNYSVLVFDIDNFKHVNDSFGHQVGNEVLQKTADFFMKEFSRENYEFFRVGGDEFAAIASGVTEAQVQQQVMKINQMEPDCKLGYSYSCGFSSVDFSRESAFETAFIEADRAMYAVKTAKKSKR